MFNKLLSSKQVKQLKKTGANLVKQGSKAAATAAAAVVVGANPLLGTAVVVGAEMASEAYSKKKKNNSGSKQSALGPAHSSSGSSARAKTSTTSSLRSSAAYQPTEKNNARKKTDGLRFRFMSTPSCSEKQDLILSPASYSDRNSNYRLHASSRAMHADKISSSAGLYIINMASDAQQRSLTRALGQSLWHELPEGFLTFVFDVERYMQFTEKFSAKQRQQIADALHLMLKKEDFDSRPVLKSAATREKFGLPDMTIDDYLSQTAVILNPDSAIAARAATAAPVVAPAPQTVATPQPVAAPNPVSAPVEAAPAAAQPKRKERIFISYKRVDKDKVFPIKNYIETQTGLHCWIDLDGIESNAQFRSVIIKAIDECEVLLFMYSEVHTKITDLESDWTFKELDYASDEKKRIVFVNLDGSPLVGEFKFEYKRKQQVDARSNEAMDKLCIDLLNWLDPQAE